MTKLVKLPNGDWVNPGHLRSMQLSVYERVTETVLVIKGGNIKIEGDRRDEIAAIIQAPEFSAASSSPSVPQWNRLRLVQPQEGVHQMVAWLNADAPSRPISFLSIPNSMHGATHWFPLPPIP